MFIIVCGVGYYAYIYNSNNNMGDMGDMGGGNPDIKDFSDISGGVTPTQPTVNNIPAIKVQSPTTTTSSTGEYEDYFKTPPTNDVNVLASLTPNWPSPSTSPTTTLNIPSSSVNTHNVGINLSPLEPKWPTGLSFVREKLTLDVTNLPTAIPAPSNNWEYITPVLNALADSNINLNWSTGNTPLSDVLILMKKVNLNL